MTPTSPKKRLHLDPNLHIVFAVTLMAVMGVASVTPAFPRIAEAFGISPKQIGYLITVFTVPGVFLTPVLGVLADRTSRKRILAPSLFLFGAAGVACAFVNDFNTLLMLRFIQGVGAAGLGSLNVTIMGDLYAGHTLTTAMGYNSSVLSIGTATYPLIGGALAMLGWHYPFVLPIVAIPVGIAVLTALESPEPANQQRLRSYFADVWQIVRGRSVIGLLLAGLVTFIGLYGAYLTFLPFLISDEFGGSPLSIGLIMSAASLATAVTSARLGSLARRFSEKSLLATGYIFFAASLALVPFASNIWQLVPPALVYGVGSGLNIPNIISLLSRFAPLNQRAAVMSINGMVLRLGQTLGPMIMAGVYSVWGLDAVFYAGAIFTLGMCVLAVIMIRQPDERGV